MKAAPAITKRSHSKRSDRDTTIATNHDLLKQIHNRAVKSKSTMEEGFPEQRHHQKSRPSLIERKHHDNVSEATNQQTIVRTFSLNTLLGCLERLLSEEDLLPIVKRKVRDAMGEVQAQLAAGIKRLESLLQAQSNRKLNEDKLSKDLTRLQKKIDSGRELNRKLEQEKDSLAKKVEDLERKLDSKGTVATAASSGLPSHNTSVHGVSVNSSFADQKKLRSIMLGQSQVINQQQSTIEQHRQELSHAKQHTEQLYHMLLFQSTSMESLLPRLNKYCSKHVY